MKVCQREAQSLDIDSFDKLSPRKTVYLESLIAVNFQFQFYDDQAIQVFDALPENGLPLLPWGYHWQRSEHRYVIFKICYANEHHIELILYGPDEKGQINYNLVVDQNNHYSLFHTRDKNQIRLKPKDRSYPEPIKKNASGYFIANKQYMPGHCGDHVDSIIPPEEITRTLGKACCSSYNKANYIPEIKKDYWGLNLRKALVRIQRASRGLYAQWVEYPDNFKNNGFFTAVPESVYFYQYDLACELEQVYWIDWSRDYNLEKKPKNTRMKDHLKKYRADLMAAPKALLWNINIKNSDWKEKVLTKQNLGDQIINTQRTNTQENSTYKINNGRDQLYAYGAASSFEYRSCFSSVSLSLSALDYQKYKLADAAIQKVIKHGEKLLDCGYQVSVINRDNQLKHLISRYQQSRLNFGSDTVVDALKQLC